MLDPVGPVRGLLQDLLGPFIDGAALNPENWRIGLGGLELVDLRLQHDKINDLQRQAGSGVMLESGVIGSITLTPRILGTVDVALNGVSLSFSYARPQARKEPPAPGTSETVPARSCSRLGPRAGTSNPKCKRRVGKPSKGNGISTGNPSSTLPVSSWVQPVAEVSDGSMDEGAGTDFSSDDDVPQEIGGNRTPRCQRMQPPAIETKERNIYRYHSEEETGWGSGGLWKLVEATAAEAAMFWQGDHDGLWSAAALAIGQRNAAKELNISALRSVARPLGLPEPPLPVSSKAMQLPCNGGQDQAAWHQPPPPEPPPPAPPRRASPPHYQKELYPRATAFLEQVPEVSILGLPGAEVSYARNVNSQSPTKISHSASSVGHSSVQSVWLGHSIGHPSQPQQHQQHHQHQQHQQQQRHPATPQQHHQQLPSNVSIQQGMTTRQVHPVTPQDAIVTPNQTLRTARSQTQSQQKPHTVRRMPSCPPPRSTNNDMLLRQSGANEITAEIRVASRDAGTSRSASRSSMRAKVLSARSVASPAAVSRLSRPQAATTTEHRPPGHQSAGAQKDFASAVIRMRSAPASWG